MKRLAIVLMIGAAMMACVKGKDDKPAQKSPEMVDPYLWLEDITGEKPIAWVRERNAESEKELGGESFKQLEAGILKIMDSEAKLPYISKKGNYYYNFWKDAKNPRGLWRRTTLEEYRQTEPKWETVLDIDALGKTENESWVFQGAQFLRPGYDRCLMSLSRGGSDASVVREFDLSTKSFVKDGFQLPQAKSDCSWIDIDTLFVGTDFGPDSLTNSGYPRIAKIWKRGTPLAQAKTIFEAAKTDVAGSAFHDPTKGFERDFLVHAPSFFTQETFLLGKDGSKQKIDVPADAENSVNREWLLVKPRTQWIAGGKTYAAGSLLAARFDDYMAGKRELTVLFEPTQATSLAGYDWTRHCLILNVLDNVKNKLYLLTPQTGKWKQQPFEGAPAIGTVTVGAVDPDESDDYFMEVTDFLTPPTLHYGTIGKRQEKLKEQPAFFDAKDLEISQHFTQSKDGTRIPYFQVSKKNLSLDGSHPALLAGYGGFEVSEVPTYSGVAGYAWMSRGGVFVLANIRGGGEYGPAWHQSALKQNRFRCYEDFAAVARDLVSRKVTSAKRLGIAGGSNGGLLVGNMLTQYPQLIGAVVCQIPLLDMKRYTHLLAGASWIEEYGDPDKPEEWAFIKTFSPYQNVKAGMPYPPTLFMTTTKDDRVHPAHARKMMARMKEMGYDVRYYENIEGGHGAGADNKQAAHFQALEYSFLWQKLMR
jgi:prolyl oligopeptidase